MQIYKGYQFRLYPDKNQRELINQNICSSRYVYNYFLSRKNNYYQECKGNLSLKDLKNELVMLKNEQLFLKTCDSMALTNSLEDLDTAFTNFYNKRSSLPVFKKKGIHDKYKTNCIRSSYKNNNYANILLDLKNRTITLPKIGKVKIRGYRDLKKDLYIINATISKTGNKYYVSICCKETIVAKEFVLRNAIGIDVGVSSLITTSDGIKYPKLKVDRIIKHIEVLQQRLSKCIKNSKNYIKLKNKITRLHQKIRNMRKYYAHEITNEVIKEHDLIVCETLHTKDMVENSKSKSLKRGILNATFHEILWQFSYKTKWKHKEFIQINPYYPSSKICSHCGTRNEVNDISIRSFECTKCKYINDRDYNASVNILDEGIKLAFRKGLFN